MFLLRDLVFFLLNRHSTELPTSLQGLYVKENEAAFKKKKPQKLLLSVHVPVVAPFVQPEQQWEK